jgi:hypothetical protein
MIEVCARFAALSIHNDRRFRHIGEALLDAENNPLRRDDVLSAWLKSSRRRGRGAAPSLADGGVDENDNRNP